MTQTPPQFTTDGVEIVAIQQGCAPHPHPSHRGELVPFRHLEELLLADNTTRFRCVKPVDGNAGPPCNRDDFDNPRSAVSHANSHGRENGPRYSDETLRAVIRLCRTYRSASHRDYAARTADELNRRGMATLDGDPWTNTQVSSLFNAYQDRYRTHVRRSEVAKIEKTATAANGAAPDVDRPAETRSEDAVGPAALDRRSAELLTRAGDLFEAQRSFARELADLFQDVGAALTRASEVSPVDPAILDKARKWDQAQELFGNRDR